MKIISAELIVPVTLPPLRNAALAIDKGKIGSFGPRTEILKEYPTAEEIHHQLVIPGLINAHTHVELSSIPFSGPPGNFVSWMISLIEKKRELDPVKIEQTASAEIARFPKMGVTSIGDIASHPVMLKVHAQSPLFSTMFFELIGIRAEDVPKRMELVQEVLGEVNYRLRTTCLGLSPHTPYTASEALYNVARDFARERRMFLCSHIAESAEETELIMRGSGEIAERFYPFVGWKEFKPAATGLSPVQYLKEMIDRHISLVHCVEVSDEDIEVLAQSRSVIHCPRSNLNLTGKLAPVPKMIKAGVCVALGTDSPASAGDADLWNEMKKVYELRTRYPGGEIKPSEILKMATISAARAIFRDREVGSIEAGKIANLVALDLKDAPRNEDGLAELIILTGHQRIDAVYLAGEKISPA